MGIFLPSTILLLVCIVFIENGAAIRCYECNSHDDKRCLGDERYQLEDDMIKPCPDRTPEGHTYKLCRKIKQVIDFDVNGLPPESRIIRGCGWDNSSYGNRCYHRSGFGGRQDVCACDGDHCNHAPNTILAPLLLLILITIVLLSFFDVRS